MNIKPYMLLEELTKLYTYRCISDPFIETNPMVARGADSVKFYD